MYGNKYLRKLTFGVSFHKFTIKAPHSINHHRSGINPNFAVVFFFFFSLQPKRLGSKRVTLISRRRQPIQMGKEPTQVGNKPIPARMWEEVAYQGF